MPKDRKSPRLRTYSSVAEMVAAINGPRAAITFLATLVGSLQSRVRVLELKVAVLGSEAEGKGRPRRARRRK